MNASALALILVTLGIAGLLILVGLGEVAWQDADSWFGMWLVACIGVAVPKPELSSSGEV